MSKIKSKQIADVNVANGLVKLNSQSLIPNNLITQQYVDKQIYYKGELFTIDSSQYWKVLESIYINEVHFELNAPPNGSGQTVVKLIRNNNVEDTIYQAVFSSGDSVFINQNNILINANDRISLSITETTAGFHGSDLAISIKYSKFQD